MTIRPLRRSALLAALLLPAVCAAQPEKPAAGGVGIFTGLRAGGLLPVANGLDPTFVLQAEGAWAFALDRTLGAYLDIGYASPRTSGARTDPRLGVSGGEEQWQLQLVDVSLSFGPRYQRFVAPEIFLMGAAGPAFHFTRAVVTAKVGDADLGTNTEYAPRVAGVARVGAGYRLGPGAATAELRFDLAPVWHLVTGDANTSNLSLQVGYGMFF